MQSRIAEETEMDTKHTSWTLMKWMEIWFHFWSAAVRHQMITNVICTYQARRGRLRAFIHAFIRAFICACVHSMPFVYATDATIWDCVSTTNFEMQSRNAEETEMDTKHTSCNLLQVNMDEWMENMISFLECCRVTPNDKTCDLHIWSSARPPTKASYVCLTAES